MAINWACRPRRHVGDGPFFPQLDAAVQTDGAHSFVDVGLVESSGSGPRRGAELPFAS